MIYLDTETTKAREDVPDPAPALACVQLDGPELPPLTAADEGAALVGRLLDEGASLCAHFFPFDFGALSAHTSELLPAFLVAAREGRLFDTMCAAKLADIATGYGRPGKRPYSLGTLCAAYHVAEKRDPQGWRLRFGELRGRPISEWPAAAVAYATGDTTSLRELWGALAAPLRDGQGASGEAQVARHTAYSVALQCLTLRGVAVDQAAVDALERRAFDARLEKLRRLAGAGVVTKGGGRKTLEIRRRVVVAYGNDTPRTEKGAVSTERKTLEQSGDPDLVLLASLGADEKLLTQYVPSLRNARGIVCPSYGVLKRSGRTGSYGPNIQNFPRRGGARECIIARPGCLLLSVDFHQIELCAFAQVCIEAGIDSPTARALLAGEDLHARTAAQLMGHPYDGTRAEDKRWRQIAKAPNFGRPGAMGPRRLLATLAKEGIILPQSEGARLMAAHDAAFPDVSRYLKWAEAEHVAGRPAVVAGSGRVRRSASWTSEANTRFQGRAADGCLDALLAVVCACYVPGGALYGSRAWPVAFVHDEIVVEVIAEECAEVGRIVSEIMVAAMRECLPAVAGAVTTDAHAGARWGK